MNDWPESWQVMKLGNVASRIVSGATPESGSSRYYAAVGGTPFAKIDDLSRSSGIYLTHTSMMVTTAALRETSLEVYPAETILLSMYGTIGLVKIAAEPLTGNQALAALLPPYSADPHFLCHYLNWLRSSWVKYQGQTTQANISGTIIRNAEFPFPPPGEQRRIAEILDALDVQIAKGRDELAKREVIRSGLAADCARGALAEADEWRGLGQIAEVASGVTLGSEPGGGSAVSLPYLRVANVQDGFFDLSDMKNLRVLRSDVSRYSLQSGDLLLTEGGDWDKLGRGAVWDGRIAPCLYQNHIFRVRCDGRLIIPEYLALYASSPAGKAYFARIAKQTSNLATINSTELKAMPVPLPSLDIQRKWVDSLNAWDEAVRAANESISSIESLREGVMEDLLTGRVRV